MKKLILLTAVLFTTMQLNAQSRFVGKWQGILSAGQELTIVFHIEGKSDDSLTAKLDVPTQKATGILCSGVTADGDHITINMKALNGGYEGVLTDAEHIEGMWIQNGMSLPLTLTTKDELVRVNRPQTPKPPFTYNSEDIIYYNADSSIRYGATITTPKDDKQHPALILITGSGAQNRNEEIFGHKPFAVIADHLTKKGYVVLRVDDEGVGKTTGNPRTATTADFAKDVMAGLTYLKTRKEVNKKKIGLLGHSEGGLIAPMVANMSDDIDFIILMAGPGIKITQVMTEQNLAILESTGLNKTAVVQYGELYKQLVEIVAFNEGEEAISKMNTVIDKWIAKTDSATVLELTNITDEASKSKFVHEFAKLGSNPWYKYFLAYDPGPALRKLDCKVLALNGSKDIQVVSTSNLAGIKTALKESKVKNYEVKELEGLNHLFQECKTCTSAEYAQLEQTIKPEVLEIISDWLDKNVK